MCVAFAFLKLLFAVDFHYTNLLLLDFCHAHTTLHDSLQVILVVCREDITLWLS